MNVPLLGQVPAGICIACKGNLTPDHEHVYIDKKELAQMRADAKLLTEVLVNMVKFGCALPYADGTIAAGHPPLDPPYMWYPVIATHVEHEGCDFAAPHHHCSSEEAFEVERDGQNEVPAATVGA
jgi:hypothetical protein